MWIKALGTWAMVALVIFYGIFSWGFVAFKFWHWFVMPVFSTLPSVTKYQMYGLLMFIRLFGNGASISFARVEDKEATSEDKVIAVATAVLMPWVILLAGYLLLGYIY